MRKFCKLILIFLIAFFSLSTLLTVFGAATLYKYSGSCVDDELIDLLSTSGTTQFYRYEFTDREERLGVPVLIENASLDGANKHEYVSYEMIPKNLINAFVAIEDKRFWKHGGVDYLRSGKAVLNYIIAGQKSFGGSTITQQLVKNLTGNDQYLIKRKLNEAFSAINLEHRYDKTQIIEMYLNVINLANGCRGIGAAARYYFSKSASDLDLNEAASIAAITNNPSKYDPIKHPEENKKRRHTVLDCMLKLGYISHSEYDEAYNAELILNVNDEISGVNSWYIDTVIEDVITDLSLKYGITRKTASLLLYKGGYKIYTLMDKDIQDIVEKYYQNKNNFPENSDGTSPQSSMIIIDPYTGDILAIAGGVGAKKGNRLLNFATDSKRPSGSAIKPLSVYAPGIENGIINWSTIISDSPIYDGDSTKAPWPANANQKYVGDVTVEYAVKHSLNTVAVKVLHSVGNSSSFNFLYKKLNISSLSLQKDMGDASLALGQHSIGISLRELVSGYTIFENGIYSPSRTYAKVTDMNGKIILDNTKQQSPVISVETAAIMTKLLQGVTAEGTAKGLITLTDVCETAGKTGTTQYNHDKYFVGYTPTLLAGVWQGYESPRSLAFTRTNYSAKIWNDIMCEIYNKIQFEEKDLKFRVPNTVQELSYDLKTGQYPNESTDPDQIFEGWYNVRGE